MNSNMEKPYVVGIDIGGTNTVLWNCRRTRNYYCQQFNQNIWLSYSRRIR